jgi:uncharacterized membrane protein YvbJ
MNVCAHGACPNCGWQVRYPHEKCENCNQSIQWVNSLPDEHRAEIARIRSRCDFWRHVVLLTFPTFITVLIMAIAKIAEAIIK